MGCRNDGIGLGCLEKASERVLFGRNVKSVDVEKKQAHARVCARCSTLYVALIPRRGSLPFAEDLRKHPEGRAGCAVFLCSGLQALFLRLITRVGMMRKKRIEMNR